MKPKDGEKLEAIAEATFALVESVGLSGLTMADIARSAGIATGTLYVYYSSKEELIRDLYRKSKVAAAGRLLEGYDERAPYRSRARMLWRNAMKERLDHYAQGVFHQQYLNSPWSSDADRELSSSLMKRWFDFLDEGKAQEIVKKAPSSLITALFLGSIRATADLLRGGALRSDEETLETAFALCWDAMKA
jgi:TetR/AcrR family transcriptional repressor of multidrug resistance operon